MTDVAEPPSSIEVSISLNLFYSQCFRVIGRLGEMEFAHLLGSDTWIYSRDLNASSHGSGGPFVVIGVARLLLKPSPLILLLSCLGQCRPCRLDDPSLIHLGQSGDDNSSSGHLQEFVLAIQQLSRMSVVHVNLDVRGGPRKSRYSVDTGYGVAGGRRRSNGEERLSSFD